MIDYQKLYALMFNGVTKIINEIDKYPPLTDKEIEKMLKQLQCDAEEDYLRQEDIIMYNNGEPVN